MYCNRVKKETAENVRNGAGLLCLEVQQRISVQEKDNTGRKVKDITHQKRAKSFNIIKKNEEW